MVVLFFAQQVFIRWLHRRDCTHLLVWSFGLALYAIGNFTEALYGPFGWRDGWGEVNFRLWYICGAVWSAAHFWRQQTNPNRLIGNVLLALGAMSPANGGVINRFGVDGLYVGELVGAILVFSGFIAITREADLNLRTRRADANR